jgi:hypothetical protein
VNEGMLSTSFVADVRGERRFLKTHLLQSGRPRLAKEIAILTHLYGATLNLASFEVIEPDGSRMWLVMDELAEPPNSVGPEATRNIIASFAGPLQACQRLIAPDDDFQNLLRAGRMALEGLSQGGLLSHDLQTAVHRRLQMLGSEASRFQPVICHGDLGPRNVMFRGDQPIVVDWEDAFCGMEGYDYLYWLTFFKNRTYYAQPVLGTTPWGRSIEVAVMVLIVILKCELSLRAEAHTRDAMSFEQRIDELIALDRDGRHAG